MPFNEGPELKLFRDTNLCLRTSETSVACRQKEKRMSTHSRHRITCSRWRLDMMLINRVHKNGQGEENSVVLNLNGRQERERLMEGDDGNKWSS